MMVANRILTFKDSDRDIAIPRTIFSPKHEGDACGAATGPNLNNGRRTRSEGGNNADSAHHCTGYRGNRLLAHRPTRAGDRLRPARRHRRRHLGSPDHDLALSRARHRARRWRRRARHNHPRLHRQGDQGAHRLEAGSLAGLHQTASFAALTGRTLRIFLAGFALNTVGSLVKGLMPLRSLVAGFLTTMNLAKPGSRNSPLFFISL